MLGRNRQRGSTLVEFTLCSVLIVFVLISALEMVIAMWNYDTLQYAVKVTGSYIAVHGATCGQSPNNCTVEIKDIASVLNAAAQGLPDSNLQVTFTSNSGTTKTCNPLNTCYSDTTQWPPTANSDNAVGNKVTIRADYTFISAISMLAPGTQGINFGSFDLPGYTQQLILF